MYTVAMPSETLYLKDAQIAYLDELVETTDGINNRSQAAQYCIKTEQQREELEQ